MKGKSLNQKWQHSNESSEECLAQLENKTGEEPITSENEMLKLEPISLSLVNLLKTYAGVCDRRDYSGEKYKEEPRRLEEKTERQRAAKELDSLFGDLTRESKKRFEAILNKPNMFKQQYQGEQYIKWFSNERQIWRDLEY
eukprot:3772565-Heterocapsa_arctica.AAC.1